MLKHIVHLLVLSIAVANLGTLAHAQTDLKGVTGGAGQTGSTGQTGAGQVGETDSPVLAGSVYQKAATALTMMFGLAVLLESAFALIFSWRVFLTYFSVSGVKTIIMFIVSWLVVAQFHMDILNSLVGAFNDEHRKSEALSKVITAMILAGGSTAVNNVMLALGLRSLKKDDLTPPKPPPDKAWVAVVVHRQNAVGDISVKLQDLGPASAIPNAPAAIAGTVGKLPSLKELLFRNANRFPQNGGHTVVPGNAYKIAVEGRDNQGKAVTAVPPFDDVYVFAPGAIVNFEVTL